MILATKVVFPRAVVPEEADFGAIEILGFSDGGEPASAACIYVRTQRREIGPKGVYISYSFSLVDT